VLFGIFFSLVFAGGVGLLSGCACSYGIGLKYLLGILAGVYICWAFGGLCGMGLATLSPEFYRRTFIGVPADPEERLRYAWVGGSIWGAEFGGLVSVILGLVLFRSGWRRRRQT
jgi:hypothetical protein